MCFEKIYDGLSRNDGRWMHFPPEARQKLHSEETSVPTLGHQVGGFGIGERGRRGGGMCVG